MSKLICVLFRSKNDQMVKNWGSTRLQTILNTGLLLPLKHSPPLQFMQRIHYSVFLPDFCIKKNLCWESHGRSFEFVNFFADNWKIQKKKKVDHFLKGFLRILFILTENLSFQEGLVKVFKLFKWLKQTKMVHVYFTFSGH